MKNYELKDFFDSLYCYCDSPIIEVRQLQFRRKDDSYVFKQRDFLRLNELKKFTAQNGFDAFYTVCPRDGKDGTKEGITCIPCMWIDLDQVTEQSKKNIKTFPLKPTAVVRSGRGYHLYWRLKEPLERDDFDLAERYLKALATYLNADTQSAEIARVLRLPNTYNSKYTPPILAKIVRIDTSKEILLEDLDNYLVSYLNSKVYSINNNIHSIDIHNTIDYNCKNHAGDRGGQFEDESGKTDDNRRQGGIEDKWRQTTTNGDKSCAITEDARIALHHRNDTLFHIAWTLRKGGMPEQEIATTIKMLALHACEPCFSLREADQVVASVVKRAMRYRKEWKDAVLDHINGQTGLITTSSIHSALGAYTKSEKSAINKCLQRLAAEGVIVKTGRRVGEYKIISGLAERADWRKCKAADIDVWLPLGLTESIRTIKGGMLAFAAHTNVGKTAFGINIAVENCPTMKTRYLSTELSPDEFAERIRSCWGRDDYDIEFFDDVIIDEASHYILPDGLSIVDYVEPPQGDYSKIAYVVAEIHRAIKDGIAVVLFQSKSSGDVMGGEYVKAKPHLFVRMKRLEGEDGNCQAEIIKAKRPKKGYRNPDGCKCIYSINEENGVEIIIKKPFRFRKLKEKA